MNLLVFKWRSIATRVTLLTLIFFLISIWAIMAYVSRILHEDVQRVLGSQQFSTTSYIAAAVNNELNDRLNALNVVAKQISATVLGNTAALQALLEQRPILAGLFTGSVWVSRQDGIAIASLMPELIGTNYADREYLITVLKDGKAAISKPITGKVMKDAIFVMAVPIRDEQGKVIGALAGVVDLGRPNFLDKFTEVHYGKTGNHFIVDPQNRIVITSTDKSRVMQPLPAPGINPMIDRFVQGYEGSEVLVNAVGKEVLSSSKLIPLTGWAVSISLPTEEAFAPIHDLELRIQIITIIMIFLAGCLIWLVVSRTLQRQLSPMLVASRMLATMCDTDQSPQLLPVTSQDEIGELIGGFNRLLETLGKREQTLISSEEQLHNVVESVGEGIILQDASERILLWNKTASEIFGLDADKITVQPAGNREWSTIREDGSPFPVQDHPSLHTLRTGQSCSGVIMGVKRSEHDTRWLKINTRPLFSHEGQNPYAVIISFSDLTERKKYEEALRESDHSFRTLSNSGTALIWTSDTDRLCTYFNSVWLKFTGRSLEQELGNGWAEGVHPDDLQRCLDISVTAFDRQEGFSKEYRLRHHDGTYRWIVDEGCPRYDSHGEFLGYIGHCLDITERKRAEEENARLQYRLHMAQEAADSGSWEWNLATNENIWSDELWKLYGLDPKSYEPSYDTWLRVIHPDDRAQAEETVQKAASSKSELNVEWRTVLQDGTTRWLMSRGKPIVDENGQATHYLGIVIDITERKLAELNYQALFNEMLGGFALHEIIVDDLEIPVNYRFLAVNPAFERMTGLKAVDIIGHTVLDIMPDTEMRWIETYGRVALTGEPVHFEDYSAALQKYYEVTAYRPAPGQFACIVTDVTEKKHAEEEKKQLQVQLQQAQKMEAIGTLAGGIAHDFNNILGAILGYAEMVQEDSPAGSRTRGDIDQVVKASHRAKELVKQILNFSRQAATEKIPLQPALIIKEGVKMLRSSLPSTIDLQQDVDPDVGLILADPTQIHQVLVNLCTNAFHAMEETGGTLTISLKKKTLSKADLANEPSVQPGDFVELSIGDTGTGIAPEIQQKMFDPFFTTKEVGKGTGMGLAIIHGIAKSYNGFVTCHSQLGEGTVFEVYLPVIQDPALLEIEPVTFDLPQLGNERILFIDDEEILAEMGEAMLSRLGYRVTVRRNSIEALNTFQNQPDEFDLVITDQTMPGMTGSDLARRMLQIRPGIPIILCTGYSSLITEEKARGMGIKGFAMKPLAKKDIAALIREVLDGGKPLS